MDVDAYMQDRLQDQLDWHDRKSQWNQRWYKRLQVAVIAAGAAIPVLVSLGDRGASTQIAVGTLGALIAIATGLAGTYRFQEHWIQYRVTAEALGHEKFRFLTGAAPYDQDDAFPRLVERVEAILGEQNNAWRRGLSGDGGAGEGP